LSVASMLPSIGPGSQAESSDVELSSSFPPPRRSSLSVFGNSVRDVLRKARKDVAPLMAKAGPLVSTGLATVIKPVEGIIEYRDRKRRNHRLAMELWELHASPIMKGIQEDAKKEDVLAYSGLDNHVAKGGDAGMEKSEKLKKMSKKERVEFREKERAEGNKIKKERKDKKEEERKVKQAKKVHEKKVKEDLNAQKLDEAKIKAEQKELEKKMDKMNLTEEEKKLKRRMLKSTRAAAVKDKIGKKYGRGKMTKEGNVTEEELRARNKVDIIKPKEPGQAVGWTKGVTNILGVYKWGYERDEEKMIRHDHQQDVEDMEAKKLEAEVIRKTKERNEKKAKKKRMKKNGGKDPFEVVETRAEKIKKAQKEGTFGKKKRKDGDVGGLGGGEFDEFDEFDSDSDSDSDESVDSRVFMRSKYNFDFQEDFTNAQTEGELMALEFKKQEMKTRNMLKRMGVKVSTKRCTACGSKEPNRPIDYWTGLPKGGKANRWYAIGEQYFCYPCANNGTLMMGVAKALAVMNGLKAADGIKDWNKVKKMKFRFEYNIDESHETNKASFKVEEKKGSSLREIREKKMRMEERVALRKNRLMRGEHMKQKDKTLWWQKKRRKEENYWHVEEIAREGKNFSRRSDINAVNRKTPKIMGANWETYKHWFPRDQQGHAPR